MEFKRSRVGSCPHYRARSGFMDEKEIAAYDALVRVFDDRISVFAKVWLAELVQWFKPHPSHLQHWRRVQRRRIDFLICAGDSFDPILAVRLETEAQSRMIRRRGPDVVDDVLEDIGLPLLRMRPRRHYDTDDLIRKINFAIQEDRPGRAHVRVESPHGADPDDGSDGRVDSSLRSVVSFLKRVTEKCRVRHSQHTVG